MCVYLQKRAYQTHLNLLQVEKDDFFRETEPKCQKHSSGNSEMIYNPTYCMMIYIIYVAIHPVWVNFAARPCWPQSETRGSCTSVCTAGRGCGTFRLQSGAGPRLHCSAGWLDWFYWNKDWLSPRWVGRTLTLIVFNIN